MKTLFNLIKIIIIFAIVAVAFFLLINKTFIYEVYKTNTMTGDGIPMKRFNYFLSDEDGQIKLASVLNLSSLEKSRDDYLSRLEYCYGKYYYDSKNMISISDYKIEDKGYYRLISLKYEDYNYCNPELKLRDTWIYEYNSLTTYEGGDISEKDMTKFIETIYESKKIDDPVITDYKPTISYKINCYMKEYRYVLVFEDFGENYLKVTKKYNNKEEFAVYEINDVVNYLKSLERQYDYFMVKYKNM